MRVWNQLRDRFSGIRTSLLLSYLIIILISILVVGAISYYTSFYSTSQRMKQASAQIAQQIESNLDNDLHSKRNLLLAPYYDRQYIDGINAYPELDSNHQFVFRQSLVEIFLKFFNTTPITDFSRFQIYFGNGQFLGSSGDSQSDPPDVITRTEWFKETVAANGQVYVFAADAKEPRNPKAKDYAYSMAMMIRDFTNPNHFIIIRADYQNSLIRSMATHAGLTEGSEFLILDGKDRPVYASMDGADKLLETITSELGGASGSFWTEAGQNSYFVSYSKSGYSKWKTVLLVPRAEIFSPLAPIKMTILLTMLTAFVIVMLLSIMLGRIITKPILDLNKSINRIRRGDFSVRLQVNRKDEIGRIAQNFNLMQADLQEFIENKYIYQIKLQQAELKTLYSQINPHFLYNTLDSIKAMADYYQVEEIAMMSQSLADMFRYNIKSSDEYVTLREELEQVEHYIQIQSFRFEGRFQYVVQVDEALMDYPILKMTLQPLVENAFYHGIEPVRKRSTITVSAYRQSDGVLLQVRDDGAGMSSEQLSNVRQELLRSMHREEQFLSTTSSGIGIRNVYARYMIRYSDQVDFQVESSEGEGTSISILVRENFVE